MIYRIQDEHQIKACRTRELFAEQKFTRDHWRKQIPPVCGDVLKDFVPGEITSPSVTNC